MRNRSRHFSEGKHFCAFRAFCETITSRGEFIARRNRRRFSSTARRGKSNRRNIICSANIWYMQPREVFFPRKTFLRFLRFLRDHYFSRGGFIARRNRRNRRNIICSANTWYAQPLEAFFRRKTFLRFLRFLRAPKTPRKKSKEPRSQRRNTAPAERETSRTSDGPSLP